MHSYKKLVKYASESVIQTILDELVAASEISLKKNLYSLSDPRERALKMHKSNQKNVYHIYLNFFDHTNLMMLM